jgi:hypothetical protein
MENVVCWFDYAINVVGNILQALSSLPCVYTKTLAYDTRVLNTGSSKKMDGIWNHYNLKSSRRIYTFDVLKCSEKFKVLDLA